jgi:hypothetical protein
VAEKKRILVGGWFDLPRLGTEVWSTLVRKQGVAYEKSTGFKFDSTTDIPAAVRTLLSAGVEVELALRCYVCGKEACAGCPYLSSCDRARFSTFCLCADHAPETSVFGAYTKTFDMNLKG